jgi:hypothetical protein
MIKPKLSYANVAATLALVFSMTGSAIAAHHYLITSTKQISPKVISALKGKAGAMGLPGKEGPPGKEGAVGKEGQVGPAGTAVAYAHVLATGALDTSHSKHVENVSLIGTGLFCLKVTIPISNAVGTVDTGNSGGEFGFVSAILSGQDPSKDIPILCPEGDNALIGTAEHTGGNKNMAFWVNFN